MTSNGNVNAGSPQSRHIQFSSKDAGELSEFMSAQLGPVSVVPHSQSVETGLAGILGSVPGLVYHTNTVIGGFDCVPGRPFDALCFTFPLAGRQTIETRKHSIDIPEAAASCFDGLDLSRLRDGAGRKYTVLVIKRETVRRRLSRLLDRPVTRAVEFKMIASAEVDHLVKFASFAHSLPVMELAALGDIVPSLAKRMPEILADMALSIWPNNYSSLLAKPPARIAPRQVKIAVSYIQEHPEAFPSPDFLADLAGVSLRALQYSFHNFIGMGISEYQRGVRLQRARAELLGTSSRPVAEIGRSCGFTNPTAFSRAFKAAFGVSPISLRTYGDTKDVGH